MTTQTMSRETVFNFGYWLAIAGDSGRFDITKIGQDHLTGLIAALIDRGVNTQKSITRWIRRNGNPAVIEFVSPILWDYEGEDRFKHLWQVGKCGRLRLLFDFGPYRYDIEQRVQDLRSLEALLPKA